MDFPIPIYWTGIGCLDCIRDNYAPVEVQNMSLTHYKDFQEVLNILPESVLKNTLFFPIRQDSKNPDVPAGTDMKTNTSIYLNKYDAIKRLKWGKNVGIYALPGGLMFLDLDVKNGEFLVSTELREKINDLPTITIQTRNGGMQKYFLNEGKYGNQLISENGKIIGELRTNWQYVVSVGSYVPQDDQARSGDGTYRLSRKNRTLSTFEPIPGMDELVLMGVEKTTNKKKTTWNSNTVVARQYTNEEHNAMTVGAVWRRK